MATWADHHPPLPTPPDIVERLAAHRTVGRAPRAEIEWLAAHGRFRRIDAGEFVMRKGDVIKDSGVGMEILLRGHFVFRVDRGSGLRVVMEWQAGDIGGLLPYSRMNTQIGDTVSDTVVEIFSIPTESFREMTCACPTVTEICVHTMIDRARVFTTSDWQDEKMASLGKLAAGLAHELNNPASAIARAGQQIQRGIEASDTAARALLGIRLEESQLAAIDRVREACAGNKPLAAQGPLERADREDEIGGWLAAHGVSESLLDVLVETPVTVGGLDELAAVCSGNTLDAALGWIAAGREIRTLASEIEVAATRVSDLVSAMKRLTHMDRTPVPEPMDVAPGIRDAVVILGHKARAKSATVTIDISPDLPEVYAIGGELNQVWMNLLDNALDAVPRAGNVRVAALAEGQFVVVHFADDGPGVPAEIQSRIFDPFFTTKRQGEGTGLGLEVARTRVRAAGGDIKFESRPGRTEFKVYLPRRTDHPPVPIAQ